MWIYNILFCEVQSWSVYLNLDVCVCLKQMFFFCYQKSLQETLTKCVENTGYFAVEAQGSQ